MNYNQEETAIAANGGQNPPSISNPNFTSNSPTQINPDIVCAIPSDPHSLFGYPANPAAIVTFNSANLPTTGSTGITRYPANPATPYVYHYSLDTQHDLGSQWVASLGYQSSLGRHILH